MCDVCIGIGIRWMIGLGLSFGGALAKLRKIDY
jgi:hypothetical protein